MNISKRIDNMGRSAAILGTWTVIASLGAIALSSGHALDGEAYAISRVAIGIIGLAAAALFWSGRNYGQDGMKAILIWGALQVPFYATAEGENYSRQLIDLFAGLSSSTTVNGVYTEFSQVGFNLVGITVTAWAFSASKRLDLWRRRDASEVALGTSAN